MKKFLQHREYLLLAVIAIVWILFSVATDGIFSSTRNISNLFSQTAIVGILACGMVLVIVAGQIDLSAGSVVALTGGIAAAFNVWQYHLAAFNSILISITAGILIGCITGVLIAYANIPAFIVTLGGMLIYRGAIKGITQGETIGPISESFQFIGSEYLSNLMGWLLLLVIVAAFIISYRLKSKSNPEKKPAKTNTVLLILLAVVFVVILNSYHGIPVPVFVLLVIAALMIFVTNSTTFGRYIYAVGGNKEAAFYAGIDSKKILLLVFMTMGFLSAIAGILYTARLGNATPSAGRNLELDAIAACVIGGTSLTGGKGTITGALAGALIMTSLDNGMSLMNISDFAQDIIKGIILITAVGIDFYSAKRN